MVKLNASREDWLLRVTVKYALDYDETFSPVVRFPSIRVLLAYAVQNKMMIHQMDAVTAFLNGELEK